MKGVVKTKLFFKKEESFGASYLWNMPTVYAQAPRFLQGKLLKTNFCKQNI